MRKLSFLLFLLNLFFFAKSQTIYAYAGNGTQGYSGDGGLAAVAQFSNPVGLAADGLGNVFIADLYNNCIRKVNSSGIISTVVGNGTAGFSGDGGPASSAKLYMPYSVALDGSGNMYICDGANNRIRKVNSAGIISTICGSSSGGYFGDGGPAITAGINGPTNVFVDLLNNIYFVDFSNNVVRKIDNFGIISTLAGTGTAGFLGDGGPATSARLNRPTEVTGDPFGNIYIVDQNNNRVRKVNPSGIISTICGTFTPGHSGDGGPANQAQLYNPNGITIDAGGNLYITEFANHCIRKIDAFGQISTITGTPTGCSFLGNGGPATAGQTCNPTSITVDASNNIYFSDYSMQLVRVICANNCLAGVKEDLKEDISFSVYPSPVIHYLNIRNKKNSSGDLEIEIINTLGQIVLSSPLINSIDVSSFSEGLYTLKILENHSQVYKFKFIKE